MARCRAAHRLVVAVLPIVAFGWGCAQPEHHPVRESSRGLPEELVATIERACEEGYFDPLARRLRDAPDWRRRMLEAVRDARSGHAPNVRRALEGAIQSGDWMPVATFPPARHALRELGPRYNTVIGATATRPSTREARAHTRQDLQSVE